MTRRGRAFHQKKAGRNSCRPNVCMYGLFYISSTKRSTPCSITLRERMKTGMK